MDLGELGCCNHMTESERGGEFSALINFSSSREIRKRLNFTNPLDGTILAVKSKESRPCAVYFRPTFARIFYPKPSCWSRSGRKGLYWAELGVEVCGFQFALYFLTMPPSEDGKTQPRNSKASRPPVDAFYDRLFCHLQARRRKNSLFSRFYQADETIRQLVRDA